MRKKCLSTPPAWAFPDPEDAGKTAPSGWDVDGSAGSKTASIPAAAERVAVEKGGGSINTGRSTNNGGSNHKGGDNDKRDSNNVGGSTHKIALTNVGGSTNQGALNNNGVSTNGGASIKPGGSTNAKGGASPQVANDPPAALFCLTEIVDKPLEWVVEGVIPRGELTLITGEAGVGKSAFLAGLIANVTRGTPGPRDALRQDDALRAPEPAPPPDPVRTRSGNVSQARIGENYGQISTGRSAVESGGTRPDDTAQGRSPYAVGRTSADRARAEPNSGERNSGERSPIEPTPAAVVIFSTANMLADSVRPRLIEAGADLGKVYALCQFEERGQLKERGQLEKGEQLEKGGQLEGAPRPDGERNVGTVHAAEADSVADTPSFRPQMFQWHRDLPVLEAELERLRASGVEVSLMVIDSVDGFVEAPRRRSLLAAEVEKLAELARKFKVAIVLAANVSPAAMLRSNRPRGMAGIHAISMVARTVWMVVRDLDTTSGRMLLPIKKNCSMNRNGFAFFLHEGKVVWDDEPVGIEGEDFLREAILTPPPPLAREHQFEHDRVTQWLYDRLHNGSVSSFEIQAEAVEHEIRDASLRRAFRSLGCKTNKEHEPGGETDWYWRLPGEGFFFDSWGSRFVGQPVPDTGNLQH
jgi:hypothetical protein